MNARDEFLEEAKGKNVLCAKIINGCDYGDDRDRNYYILRSGYSITELEQFLQSLDFEYDSGFGSQLLHGHIWYEGGTWSERGEYDGSEWWEHKTCPPVPEECAQKRITSRDYELDAEKQVNSHENKMVKRDRG